MIYDKITCLAIIMYLLPFSIVKSQDSSDFRVAIQESLNRLEVTETLFNPILTDYEMIAIDQNPQIKSAYYRWKTEMERGKVVKSLPNPRVSFGYFLENVETAVGPQEYKIGLHQKLPWLPKLKLKKDVQSLKAQAEYQNLLLSINDILFKVRTTFYDYYLLQTSIQITAKNISLLQSWEALFQNRYKSGLIKYSDLIKIQIETAKLEDKLRQLKERRIPIIQTFRALLNSDSLEQIDIPDTLFYNVYHYDYDSLLESVLSNNHFYKKLSLIQDASTLALRKSKLNYYPDFGLGIDYIATRKKNLTGSNQVNGNGKDPIILMVSVDIPIWWKKLRAQTRITEYYNENVSKQVKNLENKLEAELQKVVYKLKDAQQRINLYKTSLIPKSDESLNVTEKAYIAGENDFVSLIDTQRQNLFFKLEYEKAQVEYQKALAQIAQLTGGYYD